MGPLSVLRSIPSKFGVSVLGATAVVLASSDAAAFDRSLAATRSLGDAELGSAPALDPKDGPDVDLRIAVEDDEVRMQITTNLAFLDETCDVPREDIDVLDPVEVPTAFEELVSLFKTRNVVEIDGAAVAPRPPVLARDFEIDPGDPSLIPHFVRYGARAVAKTRLTLRYSCKSPPKRVAVTWGVFPENASLPEEDGVRPPIEILCRFAAGGIDRVVTFQDGERQYTWHRAAEEGRKHFAEVPVIEGGGPRPVPWAWLGGAAGCLGLLVLGPRGLRRSVFGPGFVVFGAAAAVAFGARRVQLPDEAQALAIFEPLHENIYRAFEYTDESDVYDALAQSVDGALLEGLYDEVYRSLVLQEAGGAVSLVDEVRHLELDVDKIGVVGDEGRPGFSIVALWQVDGAVIHWGHAHTRTNEYKARYTVHAGDAGWRIAASEVLEQRRVDAAPLDDLDVGGDRWRPAEDGREF